MDLQSDSSPFRPALLVIDVQEDFCPPNGALAVPEGRDIAPLINRLLDYPFVLKVATRDFHPQDHVSFASSHDPPNNIPFQSQMLIRNRSNPDQTEMLRLWPAHCVQKSPGAEIIPEIDSEKFDLVVDKGRDRDSETYSVFGDVFGNKSAEAVSVDLAAVLKEHNISHIYAVGLAGDYCVKCSVLDAAKEGFRVNVIAEAVRSIDPGQQGWGSANAQMEKAGVKVVSIDDAEVKGVLKRA